MDDLRRAEGRRFLERLLIEQEKKILASEEEFKNYEEI